MFETIRNRTIQNRWAVGIACLVAVLATSTLPALGADATSPTVSPRLTPTGGKCAVSSGNDPVTFSGSATPGSTLTKVYFKDVDAQGAQIGELRDITSRNVVQLSPDGTISGSTTVGSFRDASRLAEIRTVIIVTKDGVEATGESQGVLYDATAPRYVSARTVGVRSVVVEFSEPVSSADGDFGPDWLVDGQPGLLMNGSGKSRTLSTSQSLGEDQEPLVRYKPIPTHGDYKDCAGNSLATGGQIPQFVAADKIPPAIPEITEVAGKDASSPVSAPDDTPSVVVEGATQGHTVELYRESSATPRFDPSQDTKLATAVAGADGVTFDQIPALGSDGSYTLYATAVDIHGNRSQDSGGSAAADDVIYTLDRVAPKELEARANGPKIAVTFTEALAGTNRAADWTVTGCTGDCAVQNVTGSGDTRVLELASGTFIPNGTQVAWSGGDYTDQAGNELQPFTSLTTQGTIALVVDLEPETGTQAVARDYTLQLSVQDELGNPVSGAAVGMRAVSGPASKRQGSTPGLIDICTSQADGSCTISYRSNATGLDTLQAWLIDAGQPPAAEPADSNTPDRQDVVTVRWTAEGADIELEAGPETSVGTTDEPNVVSVGVKELGSAFDTKAPANIEGVNVDIRATSGPNEGWLGQCDTAADGTCKISYRSTAVTDDEDLQVWIDRDRDNTPNDDLFLGQTEAQDADGSPVFDDPSQDSLHRTWLQGALPPPPPPPSVGGRYISMSSGREAVRYGRSASIGGQVITDDGCEVDALEIQRQIGDGAFEAVAQVPTNSRGGWTYGFTPERNASYRAAIQEDNNCTGATSRATFVGVKAKVLAAASRSNVRRNHCTRISGTVAPEQPGHKVVLQKKKGRTWRKIRKATLHDRSNYAFPLCFRKAQRLKFRVKTPSSDETLAGVSRRVVIRVIRKR